MYEVVDSCGADICTFSSVRLVLNREVCNLNDIPLLMIGNLLCSPAVTNSFAKGSSR